MANKTLILNEIQGYLGFDKDAEFARYLGVSPQTLSNWKSRGTFDIDLLYTKCVFLDPHWLITGEGIMLKKDIKAEATPYPIKPFRPLMASDSDDSPSHKSEKLSPKTGEKLSPALSPTHENCPICEEKDRVIAEQRGRIEDLKEYIELLKDQIPHQKKSVG